MLSTNSAFEIRPKHPVAAGVSWREIAFRVLTGLQRNLTMLARTRILGGLWCCIFAIAGFNFALAGPDVAKTAARVDELLATDHYGNPGADTKDLKPVPLVDDATFLRRVSLDLIGEIPSPEQLT